MSYNLTHWTIGLPVGYINFIEKTAKEEGITPEELHALLIQEVGEFEPRAATTVSRFRYLSSKVEDMQWYVYF